MGVLTYAFIYSCSRNTYLIILFLKACTCPLYVLRYSYHLTLAVTVFIFHSNLYLDTCSVELPGAYLLWILLFLYHDIHTNISRLVVTPVISIRHGWRRINRTNSTIITVVSQKSTHEWSILQAYQRGGWALFRVFLCLTTEVVSNPLPSNSLKYRMHKQWAIVLGSSSSNSMQQALNSNMLLWEWCIS